MSSVPEAILIAGPNGAGKTTFVRELLHVLYPECTFLNADEIQREARIFRHPVSAGRELLRRLDQLFRDRETFAVETTLATRLYLKRIRAWSKARYRTTLHFIELPSPEDAISRVAMRVAAGGHSIPDHDVRRRFIRGLELLPSYRSAVDRWYHWRSDDQGLTLEQSKTNRY